MKNAIAETKEDNQCLIYKFSYYDMIQMFVLSTVVVQDVERYWGLRAREWNKIDIRLACNNIIT